VLQTIWVGSLPDLMSSTHFFPSLCCFLSRLGCAQSPSGSFSLYLCGMHFLACFARLDSNRPFPTQTSALFGGDQRQPTIFRANSAVRYVRQSCAKSFTAEIRCLLS
jgi:hypothetical protein